VLCDFYTAPALQARGPFSGSDTIGNNDMNSPNQSEWNPGLYDDKHSFVWKFGEGVLELLAPKPGERILDLGCGTGHLTSKIAESGAKVVGIDRSPSMIEEARAAYPDIEFNVGDATNLTFSGDFDAVFSNAVLHWVKDADGAAASIARAMKPAGRFVAEFGGKDNIDRIVHALYAALRLAGVENPTAVNPWYYPSIGEYSTVLERNGFHVSFANHFDRMTPLSGEQGIRDWLAMFAGQFTSAVVEDKRIAFIQSVEELLRPSLYFDGIWHADYKRLRVVAERVVAR